jgi:hypothetical protein
MYRDTVLFKVPNPAIAQMMQNDMLAGATLLPLKDIPPKDRPPTGSLLGELYGSDDGVGTRTAYTAEEISWGLRKGYIRSDLYGSTYNRTGTDEYVRPVIRYVGYNNEQER